MLVSLIVILKFIFFSQSLNTPIELHSNQTHVISLLSQQYMIYSFKPLTDIKISFQKNIGIPQITNYLCTQTSNLTYCIQQMNKQNSIIMVKYSEYIHISYCSQCTLLLKFTTDSKKCQIMLSIYSEQIVKTLQKHQPSLHYQERTFKIQSDSNDLQIQVFILDGDCKVQLFNILHQKLALNVKRHKNLIMIKMQKKALGIQQDSEILLKISKQKLNKRQQIIYMINYEPSQSIRLMDGLVSVTNLENHQQQHFIFQNTEQYLGILTISTEDGSYLSNIIIQLTKYSVNLFQLYLRNPQIKTITFFLDPNQIIHQITVKNQNLQSFLINVIVSSIQFITLPLNFDYPTVISRDSPSYFLIEYLNTQSISIIIKKCTQSDLKLQYSSYQFNQYWKGDRQIQIQDNVEIIQIQRLGQTMLLKFTTTNYIFISIKIQKTKFKQQKYILESFSITITENEQYLDFHLIHPEQSGKNYAIYIPGDFSQQVQKATYCPQHFYYPSQYRTNIYNVSTVFQTTKTKSTFRIPINNHKFIGIRIFNQSGIAILTKVVLVNAKSNYYYYIMALVMILVIWIVIILYLKGSTKKKIKKH